MLDITQVDFAQLSPNQLEAVRRKLAAVTHSNGFGPELVSRVQSAVSQVEEEAQKQLDEAVAEARAEVAEEVGGAAQLKLEAAVARARADAEAEAREKYERMLEEQLNDSDSSSTFASSAKSKAFEDARLAAAAAEAAGRAEEDMQRLDQELRLLRGPLMSFRLYSQLVTDTAASRKTAMAAATMNSDGAAAAGPGPAAAAASASASASGGASANGVPASLLLRRAGRAKLEAENLEAMAGACKAMAGSGASIASAIKSCNFLLRWIQEEIQATSNCRPEALRRLAREVVVLEETYHHLRGVAQASQLTEVRMI
eukprot:g6328.t1